VNNQTDIQLSTHVRWLIRRDMPEVLDVENACFEYPWSKQDFICCMRRRNCIGMVAEHDSQVVGFMVYELTKDQLYLMSFAVRPDLQRCGVGTLMISKLISKLSPGRRDKIDLEVRETNLAAQLFLKRMGFVAVAILRGYYDDTPDEAYVMQYQCRPESLPSVCQIAPVANWRPQQDH